MTCCFENMMFICQDGILLYKDCEAGCYPSGVGNPLCASNSTTGGDPGGWSEPPTDPGPGF